MEGAIENVPQVIDKLKLTAKNSAIWLKLIGIFSIVSGALTALSIVGIIFAWLPIWMGVLLVQAATSATNAQTGDKQIELVNMMEKLRLYFIIQGVMIIVGIAIAVIAILGLGISLPFLLDRFN